MNLISGYHHHHHHLMHEPFPSSHVPNYFHSWVLNHDLTNPASNAASANNSTTTTDFHIQAAGGAHMLDARFDALQPGGGGHHVNKRRAPGPKKERRRTESINTAFAELRECIPNVPADTKLSKIKTLRLATSYIAYLMDVLAKDAGEAEEGFKAEIKKFESREVKRKREFVSDGLQEGFVAEKKVKGRTGWPQQVWALELNQ